MSEEQQPLHWPAATYETLHWHIDLAAGVSSGARRRESGPYEAAVVPDIAHQDVNIAHRIESDAADAATEIARFDEYTNFVFGDAEIAPLRSVLLRSESSASSQIENLTVGAKQLALAEAGQKASYNATIVAANVRAMGAAVRLAEDISPSSILDMHRALLEDSQPRHAGALRTEQVWIGGSRYGPRDAAFVPPTHERIGASLDDLVRFVRRDDVSALPHAALAHAQFETIHPFADGNGRTGRALIHAMLRRRDLATRSTVPISAGLLADIDAYFAALTAYREGDIEPIVRRVTEASHVAVTSGRALVDELAEIRSTWTEQIKARKHSATWRLRDLVIAQPAVTNKLVADRLEVSWDTAQVAIHRLEDAGILRSISTGKRDRAWVADDVLAALDAFAARAGRRAAI
jgi:Fic family protein